MANYQIGKPKKERWSLEVALMEEKLAAMEKPHNYKTVRIAVETHKLPVSVEYLVKLWRQKNDPGLSKRVPKTRGRKGLLSSRLKRQLYSL